MSRSQTVSVQCPNTSCRTVFQATIQSEPMRFSENDAKFNYVPKTYTERCPKCNQSVQFRA